MQSAYQQSKHQLWIDRISTPANAGFDKWTWHRAYVQGYRKPNYPVPAMIGVVAWDYEPCGKILELTVTDCDEQADPRLCVAVLGYRGNEVLSDYPHDSPNYR